MERLFIFLYQYRAFFTFLVLEVVCFFLIVENNQYQGTKFFNSSNTIVASLNSVSQGIREYFLLSEVNRTLAEENAALRKQLEEKKHILNTLNRPGLADSAKLKPFEFVTAKIVNNQVDRSKNFITINKGYDAGLEPGMAVISPLGVVGKIKTVSEHFAVVTSLLHMDYMVSALLIRENYFGSIQWDGRDPSLVKLKYIPRHVKPMLGDTVVTSGFNAVFPEGIMIGTVSEINLSDEALVYDLTVTLSQDFRKLSFVTVVKSNLKNERDMVEESVKPSSK
jgi:rod shape-determining protein MreC